MAASKNKIIYDVLANTTNYKEGMEDTVNLTAKASKAMKAAFIAVAAVVTASAVAFGKFEKGMSNISTIVDPATESIKGIGQNILAMSKDIPKPISELVESMYDIRSAGISAGSAIETLDSAGRLAVVGLSSTKEATDILTTSMNSFKSEGKSATEISNILFKTVKFGKNTIAELSQSFGQTAPLAKAAGLNLIEFSAATASLTAQGIPAAVAQNQIRAAMVGLEKQTASMKKVFKLLGEKDMKSLMENSDNLGDAFSKIRKASIKLDIPLGKVTGRVEGASAITVVATEGAEIYAKALNSMESGSDAVSGAFERQTATLDALKQKTFNYVNATLINLGSRLQPALISVGSAILKFFANIDNAITKNGSALTSAFQLIADVGLIAFQVFQDALSSLEAVFDILGGYQALKILGVALKVVASGFGLIVGAIKTVTTSMSGLLDDMKFMGSAIKFAFAGFAVAKIASVAVVLFNVAKATKIWAAATWVLNTAIAASPIGAIALAVIGLGAVIYDIIANFNEWELSFKSMINAAVIGWKKARSIFSSGETKTALLEEIAVLEKQNRLFDAQSEALKKRKAALKSGGLSSVDADRKAGEELDTGSLGKGVKAQFIKDEQEKVDAVAAGTAKITQLKYDAAVQSSLNEAKQRAADDAAVEAWYQKAKATEQAAYESAQEALLARKDAERMSEQEYLLEKELLNQAHLDKMLAQEDVYNKEKAKKTVETDTFMGNARKQANKDVLAMQDGMYSESMALLGEFAKDNKAAALAFKAISIGQAIVATYLGATTALKVGLSGIPAAALITAKGLMQVAKIKAQSFAVGTDFVPEDMMANIHKGEGIIPKKQNQFLQSGKMALVSPEMLNNPASQQSATPSSVEVSNRDCNISLTLSDDLIPFIETSINRRLSNGTSELRI